MLKADRFDDGLLVCRLFLGLSKDQFEAALKAELRGKGLFSDKGAGVIRYRKEPEVFVDALSRVGLIAAMTAEANREPKWSDILIERLRSGRGSAISGQRRGRGVEDFAEEIVQAVFGNQYDRRCTFIGVRGQSAKCDFAIPARNSPRIVIEAKG